jgi:hypothetical protein
MSEIYEALKRAEAERAALPPGEARTDRELLNELGQALGRIELAVAKLESLQGRALLDDFTRHATMPTPKRGRPRGKGRRT